MLRDSANTLVARVATVLVSLVVGVITARLLGPAQRGLYVLPVLDASLAIAFMSGLSSATMYFMLNERSGRGIFRAAALTGSITILGGIAGVAALGYFEHRAWTILPAALFLAPSAIISLVAGYCYGTRRVRYANYLTLLSSILSLVAMVAGLLLLGKSATVAIEMWLLAGAMTAICAFVFVVRDSRNLESIPVPFQKYFRFATSIGATNFVSTINFRIDIYIIAALSSPTVLGIYTIAVSAAEAMKILTQVVPQAATPTIGALDVGASARFTAKCIRNNLLVAFVPTLALIVLAPFALRVFFGPGFVAGADAVRILAIGMFLMAPAGLFGSYYTIKLGKPMISFWNSVASGIICAGLSIVLVPRFGMNGAAFASTVAYGVGMLAMFWLFLRDSKLPIRSVVLVQPEDVARLQSAARSVVKRVRTRAA